ncbi:MAG: hypothetical protein K6G11_02570 [Lachnospiraceae bacterium]|nr:hypothetical protein [Lachnospiraceae bacterium]
MSEKVDFHALRVIPSTILIMLLAIPSISMLTFITVSISLDNTDAKLEDYPTLGIFATIGIFIGFVSLVGTAISLYRLDNITKWFRYSQIIFVINMITTMFAQVFIWLDSILRESVVIKIFVYLLSLAPDIFLIIGVAFMLNGFNELENDLLKKQKRKRESTAFLKLKKIWIWLQIIRIPFIVIGYSMIYVVDINGVSGLQNAPKPILFVTVVSMVISALLYVLCIITGIRVFLKVNSVCQEFYLYAYNHRSMMGGRA